MISHISSYHGYRFPPEIISHAVWLYHRFCLSFRDEDLLAQRGITVTYETIRQWCQNFGLDYARRLRRRRGRMGDTWYLDELFVTIQGQRQYLWRAVDQDGRWIGGGACSLKVNLTVPGCRPAVRADAGADGVGGAKGLTPVSDGLVRDPNTPLG